MFQEDIMSYKEFMFMKKEEEIHIPELMLLFLEHQELLE
jgi:hypothetical protein